MKMSKNWVDNCYGFAMKNPNWFNNLFDQFF